MKPQLWVDTNTLVESYSLGDLYKDAPRGPEYVERRRMMAQGSLWLATALHERSATTVTFAGEALDTMLALSPPNSDAGRWPSVALYVLREYVFPEWNVMVAHRDSDLPKGREGNNPRDERMVKLASEAGIPLVTRDQKGKRRRPSASDLARQNGVESMTPEECAARVLTISDARDRFLSRLEAGARKYVAAHPDRQRCQVALDQVLEVYWTIWQPRGHFA